LPVAALQQAWHEVLLVLRAQAVVADLFALPQHPAEASAAPPRRVANSSFWIVDFMSTPLVCREFLDRRRG
jgi:hypothetical protein